MDKDKLKPKRLQRQRDTHIWPVSINKYTTPQTNINSPPEEGILQNNNQREQEIPVNDTQGGNGQVDDGYFDQLVAEKYRVVEDLPALNEFLNQPPHP